MFADEHVTVGVEAGCLVTLQHSPIWQNTGAGCPVQSQVFELFRFCSCLLVPDMLGLGVVYASPIYSRSSVWCTSLGGT